jgi:hypothetical protein
MPSSVNLFWRIVSAEGLWTMPQQIPHIWDFSQRLRNTWQSPETRAELLALLRPYLQIKPSTWRMDLSSLFGPMDEAERAKLEDQFSRVANADVELVVGRDVRMVVEAIGEIPHANMFLATLSDDLTSLLKSALDLWILVRNADGADDPSRFHQPSIEPHPQNHGYHSWTALIDLLWRGWLHIDSVSGTASRRLVDRWRDLGYLAFRRMALQAIGSSKHWTPQEKLEVLLNGI